MRPVPRFKHAPAFLICLAVAILYGGLAAVDTHLDDTQITLGTAALSASSGTLFPADPLFGARTQAPIPGPAFVGALRLALPLAGGDPVWPMRLLVGPLTLLYLLGMYGLLLRQCRSWTIAVFVAVLSSVVIETMGGATWGIGTLSSAGPAGVPLAATPLIVLGMLGTLERGRSAWHVLTIFLLVGLLGHFDLSWTLNMALILAATYLIRRRFTPSAWAAALGGLLLAVAAALPPLMQCLSARLASSATWENARTVYRMLREGDHAMLYPQAFRALPDWLAWAAPLAIVTTVTLWQVDRFRVPQGAFWAAFAGATVAVAVAFQWISHAIGHVSHTVPPLVGFVQAASLLMLPMYALFAQAVTSLFRLTVGHHTLMRTACALAAAAWLIPSDNLAPARHAAYLTTSVLLSEENQPRRLRRLEEQAGHYAEIQAVAAWARSHTSADAVFLSDQSLFRLLSRRTIVAGDRDRAFLTCGSPTRQADWFTRLRQQAELLRPAAGKTDPAAIGQFVGEMSSRPPFSSGSAWYVVLPASAAPEATAILTEETSPDWGLFVRLYRVK